MTTEVGTRISLPLPPSVNGLFVNVRGRGRVRSEGYRKWALEAGWMLKAQRPGKFLVPVNISIEINPPNGRAFDLDNRNKALLDLLVEHQIIPDDSIRWVRKVSIQVVKTGAPCTVELSSFEI
jgi:Holliday junction resolvase RusA-like endonuclease